MRDFALQESGFRAPGVSDSIEPATIMEQPWLAGRLSGIGPEYEHAT